MKLSAEQAIKLAAETGADVAQIYGHVCAAVAVEQYKRWRKAPKRKDKPEFVAKVEVDRAGMCATYVDLFEQKRELLAREPE